MKYKFQAKGKMLFFAAALICIISIFLAPVGIIFIYMALVAEISIDESAFTYRMLRKRVIPLKQIVGITIGKPQKPAYYVDVDPGGYQTISLATVIPLVIERRNGKKLKMSLNYFDDPRGVLESLRSKTGLGVVDESGEVVPF